MVAANRADADMSERAARAAVWLNNQSGTNNAQCASGRRTIVHVRLAAYVAHVTPLPAEWPSVFVLPSMTDVRSSRGLAEVGKDNIGWALLPATSY